MKRILFLTLLSVAITGFAKKVKHITGSPWKNDSHFSSEAFTHDESSGMKWWLMNDDKNIYIKIETANRKIQMAIMREGIRFNFDTIRQKSGKHYLHYQFDPRIPSSSNQAFPVRPGEPIGRIYVIDRYEDLKQNFNKAVCNGFTHSIEFEATEFEASFELNTKNIFTCFTTIPINKIFEKKLPDIHKLSIGIEIFEREKPKSMPVAGPQEGRMRHPPMNGNGGHPAPASHTNGRNQGAGPDGPPNARTEERTLKRLIKRWFLVNLSSTQD